MTKISIVYHSGYGHTEVIAKHVKAGIENSGCECHFIKIGQDGKISEADWQKLDESACIIFGSPTYMGSVSGQFKTFADETAKRWFNQSWKDKIAAGFTNSQGYSGDKLHSLVYMSILAGQHGMIWVSHGALSSGRTDNDINRIGSYIGLMAQSDNAAPDAAPPEGDKKTAELFGQRVAKVVKRFNA